MSEKDRKSTVRIFNPHTGAYEDPRPDQKNLVEEHLAQVDPNVDHAPGDRTVEELADLPPGEVGPVLTAHVPGPSVDAPEVAEAERRGRPRS